MVRLRGALPAAARGDSTAHRRAATRSAGCGCQRFGRPATEFSQTRTRKELSKLLREPDDDLVTYSSYKESTALGADRDRSDAWSRLVQVFKRRPVTQAELHANIADKVLRYFFERNLLVPFSFGNKPYIRPHYWNGGWLWDDTMVSGVRHCNEAESKGCTRHGEGEACRACYAKVSPTPDAPLCLVGNLMCMTQDVYTWAMRNRATEPSYAMADTPYTYECTTAPVSRMDFNAPGAFQFPVLASLNDVDFATTPSHNLQPDTWALVDSTVVYVEAWTPQMVYRTPFNFFGNRYMRPNVPAAVTVLPGVPSEVLAAFMEPESVGVLHLLCMRSTAEWSSEAAARVRRVLQPAGLLVLHT